MSTTRVPLDFHDLEMAMTMVDNRSGFEVPAYVCRKSREWAQENGFDLVGAGVSGLPAAETS